MIKGRHLLFIAMLVGFACGPAFAQQQAPSQAQMKTAMQSYFDARNVQDTPKLKTLFSRDATIEDPVGSPVRTANQFLDSVAASKVHFEVHLLTATQVSTSAAALTFKYALGTLNIIEIFTFKPDGKISSIRAYWGEEDRRQ